MLRYLVRMGVNILEAEDIVQDVFVHVVNDANKKRPGNLFWWLLTCAKNLAVNRYRKGKRETLVSAQLWKQWESCIADKAHGPDLLHEERESLKLFQQAILELNDIEQQCILMRGQGITFREMSNSLNLPMRNIIYLTEMAIRKIRQHLAKNSQSV